MKFAVGLMLATFGIFWSVEGVGIAWPETDLAVLGILAFLNLVSLGVVVALGRMCKAEIVLAPFVVGKTRMIRGLSPEVPVVLVRLHRR